MDLYESMLMDTMNDGRALPTPIPALVEQKKANLQTIQGLLYQWRRIKKILQLSDAEADAYGEMDARLQRSEMTFDMADVLTVPPEEASAYRLRLHECPADDRPDYLKGLTEEELIGSLRRVFFAYLAYCQKQSRKGRPAPSFWEL